MGDVKALQKSERADIQLDQQTTNRMVESLVLRGDISALNPEERARYYVQLCTSLGLTPASQPFAILRLNGKEICYPTRGATDQLAAIHRLTREIVDGPRLIDLGGTKLIYAVCRATHPNGRSETAVATVKFADFENALMKCETKAKRRATLSILGLGMLDETEIEAIPASAKSPAPPMMPQEQPETAPVEPSAELPEALAAFCRHIEDIELPGESVALWIRERSGIAKLTKAHQELAWNALVKRCEDVGRMKNAKAWLKRAIAEEDARAGSPEPDGFFDHATPEPVQPPVASENDAPEADEIDTLVITGVEHSPALDAMNEDLAPLNSIPHNTTLLQAARVWRKHKDAVYAEAGGDAKYLYEAQSLVLGVTRVGCTRNQLTEHVAALEMRDKTPRDSVYSDVMDLLELAESAEDVVEIVRKNKPAIDLRSEEIRDLLRKVATRRVQELLPDMADAKKASQWLKNALAQPPEPPNGNGGPKPDAAPANDAEDPEREAVAAEGNGTTPAQALRAKLAECTVTVHLYNVLMKYGPDLVDKEQAIQLCAERMAQNGAHPVAALKAVRDEVSRRGWKRSRRAAA
jgi:hypothetical protein